MFQTDGVASGQALCLGGRKGEGGGGRKGEGGAEGGRGGRKGEGRGGRGGRKGEGGGRGKGGTL